MNNPAQPAHPSSEYKVILQGHMLGTTRLLRADPSMGVVTGRLSPDDPAHIEVLRQYCLEHDITHEYERGFIATYSLPGLQLIRDPVGALWVRGTDRHKASPYKSPIAMGLP